MILPRWVFRAGWALHRLLFRLSGGRLGTARPRPGRVGTLFLLTTGRRTGEPRRNGLYYLEDGAKLVVVASNAGAANVPDWWLNLQARPDAHVELGRQRRPVRARLATPAERDRLWPRLVAALPAYNRYERAARRPIPVVVLEPR